MRHKKGKDRNNLLRGATVGLLTAIVVSVVGAAITSNLIIDEKLDVNNVSGYAMTILGIAILAGSILAGRFTEEKKVIATALTAVALYFVLLAANILLVESNFGMLLPGTLTVLASTTVSALIIAKKKAGRGAKRIAGTR